jgi:hypothetical protein
MVRMGRLSLQLRTIRMCAAIGCDLRFSSRFYKMFESLRMLLRRSHTEKPQEES